MNELSNDELQLLDALKKPMSDPPLGFLKMAVWYGGSFQKWISVKDKLPEYEGRYLTFGEPFGISTEYWRHDKEWQDDPYQCITHWQPLPEPPK